ncbi:MAG: 30S ribosomal protein S6 [Clostridia bacterium]|nr:30S ribosomal protein S6 [Clostridia bacterium]
MNKYEVLYILKTNPDEQAIEAQMEKYSALVTSNGGEVESVNKWGTKRFAYEIDGKNDGCYVLMNFTANSDFPKEMERQMKISDEVVRCMIVRK